MKKYILGLFVIVFSFIFISPLSALACLNSKYGEWASGQMMYLPYTASDGSSGGAWMSCNKDGSVHLYGSGNEYQGNALSGGGSAPYGTVKNLVLHRPVPVILSEPIASPVPKISPSGSSLANQYFFVPYTLPQILNTQTQLPQTTIPANDPITVGRVNPLLNSNPLWSNIPNSQNAAIVGIDSDGTVQSKFNLGVSTSIVWPPKSIFDNVTFWNQPLSNTFKAFVVGTPGTNSKYYPLNFFSVGNPISKIPLIPVTINWNVAPKTPETPAGYRFKLLSFGGLPGLDANLPTPVDVKITSPTSYQFLTPSVKPADMQIISPTSVQFSGRGMVSYFWSATPLRADGTEIMGIPVFENPIKTYIQENINIPGTPYYTWSWNKIPGAVRYEIQYALSYGDIPDSLPFTDGATFSETSISNFLGYPGSPVTETTYILSSSLNSAPGLNFNDDLGWDGSTFQYDSFHYDFANSLLSAVQDNLGQIHHVLHWRVRGLDSAGNVIRDDITSRGIVTPPLPITPYQTGYPTWSKVSGATGYVVDVVENAADFTKLPILDGVKSTTVSKGGTTTTTPAVIADDTFLLRRVAPEVSYDATSSGKIVVNKFISLLKEARIYQGLINQSSGEYDYLYSQDPTFDWIGDFDNAAVQAASGSSLYLDDYYPLVTNDLGMTLSSPISNQLKIVTSTPIDVINKSIGNAKITITHSADKKTTTLTFGVINTNSTGGSYSFDIVKLVSPGVAVYPLTYNTFGPMPVLENLTGKGFSEFAKLLPGTTYSYRVRGFKDPNPLTTNNNPLANPFIWYPWSAIKTFTTPTGVPDSITIKADGLEVASPLELQGNIPKISVKNTTMVQKSASEVPKIDASSEKNLKAKIDAQKVLMKNFLSKKTTNIVGSAKDTTSTIFDPSLGVKTINWSINPNATSYNIELYSSLDLSKTPLRIIKNIKTTSFDFKNLKPGTKYYFVIRGVNEYGIGPKAPVYSFVAPAPVPAKK